MSENKDDKLTGISKAGSVEEIAEFWDSHSLDDYWLPCRDILPFFGRIFECQ